MAEERARDVKIPSLLEWLPFLAALSSDPTVRAVGTTAGAMSLMAGNYRAFDNGERVPNQPDDFGNYYGSGNVKRDAETDRRVDELTGRVINAGWYQDGWRKVCRAAGAPGECDGVDFGSYG